MNTSEETRPVWVRLPTGVRDRVTHQLGAPVVRFEPAVGGFAGVVGFAQAAASRAFIKAIPAGSGGAEDYRTEAAVSRALPHTVPTPRLRFYFEQDGWVLLCFDALSGRHPREPWQGNELQAVFKTLDACDRALSSFDASGLPSVADRMRDRCRTWEALAGTGSYGQLTVEALSRWERLHLDRLAQVENGWVHHVDRGVLLHFDLRFDNIMLGPESRVWLLDWGRACSGPRWVDLVCLLLESDLGGIDPDGAFLAQPAAGGADPDAVDAFLVALASNWRHSAAQPPPSHAPQLQSRRIRSRDQTLAWLSRRWR